MKLVEHYPDSNRLETVLTQLKFVPIEDYLDFHFVRTKLSKLRIQVHPNQIQIPSIESLNKKQSLL